MICFVFMIISLQRMYRYCCFSILTQFLTPKIVRTLTIKVMWVMWNHMSSLAQSPQFKIFRSCTGKKENQKKLNFQVSRECLLLLCTASIFLCLCYLGLTGKLSSALWFGLNSLNFDSGWQWVGGAPFRYLNWVPGKIMFFIRG